MNKIKECLIVVGDTVNPISMYENGHKFLSRCGMHFISLAEKLYSIYCNDILKIKPSPNEVLSLMQCNQSLVYNGEQRINNTDKAIIKYTINEGLKDYIELIANNSRNFQAENLALDTIHLKYGSEICKILPYDCNSITVGDYVNKTLSILNDWNGSYTTYSDNTSVPLEADLWHYDVRDYLILGVAVVAATGIGVYAGYRCWSRKSAQEQEDVFFYHKYLNRINNLQAQTPQTQTIMESIAPKYLKIDVLEGEISDNNIAASKFYATISGGTTSAARECYESAAGAIGNSVSDGNIRNYISDYQMWDWDAAISDKNPAANELYSSIPSRLYRYAEIAAEPIDNRVSDKDISNTAYISNYPICAEEIMDENFATDKFRHSIHSSTTPKFYKYCKIVNNPVAVNNTGYTGGGQMYLSEITDENLATDNSSNIIYRAAYDATTNHGENTYILPVDEN